MKELDYKIDKLISIIDQDDNVLKIKELNNKVKEDKELNELLEKYNSNNSDEIKNKIINNENFKEYKKYETEVNLLIMYLNTRLKTIKERKDCSS